MEVDTTNKFIVAANSRGIIIMHTPIGVLTKEDALNLAAYLVAISGDEERFKEVLEAIKNT